MAMNVDLKPALALVVSDARERKSYTGTGDTATRGRFAA
jgi:hypothetical protein